MCHWIQVSKQNIEFLFVYFSKYIDHKCMKEEVLYFGLRIWFFCDFFLCFYFLTWLIILFFLSKFLKFHFKNFSYFFQANTERRYQLVGWKNMKLMCVCVWRVLLNGKKTFVFFLQFFQIIPSKLNASQSSKYSYFVVSHFCVLHQNKKGL